MDDGPWYGILRKGFDGGEVMASISERLDMMEAEIRKPRFRESTGMANEVNYWVFDYSPEKELEVRERIEYMKKKNQKGVDGFELVVFDLYDMVMDYLESKNFVNSYMRYEKRRGFNYIVRAVTTSMKVNEDDSIIVQKIVEQTPENAIVFLTGVGKCYPMLRSHKILNTLHQHGLRKTPVVLFFPVT